MSRKRDRAAVTVADVYATMDSIAPFAYAEDWDNVGLLVGWMNAPVQSVLLAIDLTDTVAEEALKKDVDLLVLYHPPIFKGIRAVTDRAAGPTRYLPDLLAARMSIIATHTAMDAAVGGTNDILLDAVAPVKRYPLDSTGADDRDYKLVVFVPPAEVDGLRRALSAAA